MKTLLSQNWWMLALRGAIALLFGILAIIWPGVTLAILVALFGAYVLVDGVFTIGMAVRHRDQRNWWILLLEGIAGVGVGFLTFFWPAITALVLVYLIAIWAGVTGVFEILAAIHLRKEISNEWLLGLSGVASVLLSLVLLFLPGPGVLVIVWTIAAYAMVFGLLLLVLSYQLRKWQHDTPAAS